MHAYPFFFFFIYYSQSVWLAQVHNNATESKVPSATEREERESRKLGVCAFGIFVGGIRYSISVEGKNSRVSQSALSF